MQEYAVTRRHTVVLSLWALAGLTLANPSLANTSSNLTKGNYVLPSAIALADEIAAAVAQGRPLVVMVSLPGCPFCHVVRNSYLAPLARDGLASIVQVDMGSAAKMRDAKGQSITQAQMIKNWGIRLAPTLLFMAQGGREVAERLVGGDSSGFYGAYLDERRQLASKALS